VAADGTELDVAGASVTRNGTGDYSVTLDTALSTANYVVQLTVEEGTNLDDIEINISNQTTTGFDVDITEQDNGGTAGVRIDKV
jgi:ribosome biogenesis SPOUT family RNA methylase Rps3